MAAAPPPGIALTGARRITFLKEDVVDPLSRVAAVVRLKLGQLVGRAEIREAVPKSVKLGQLVGRAAFASVCAAGR
jgi:hypothetical protein